MRRVDGFRDRMVVGTAQLGMSYGVSGHQKPSPQQARDLVVDCMRAGVSWFDTADSYGDGETIIGEALRSDSSVGVCVVTKGTLSPHGHSLADTVKASIRRLGIQKLAMWLLHDESQINAWASSVMASAKELQMGGLVEEFGVSAYHPEAALTAIEDLGLGAVSFPASPFDRRFLKEDVLHRLRSADTSCLVRSVFLQGLGLMAIEDVPTTVPHAVQAVGALAAFCKRSGVERDSFCIGYVLHRTRSLRSRVVVGIENGIQLKRNLEIFGHDSMVSDLYDEWDSVWPSNHEELVLPYLWPVRE